MSEIIGAVNFKFDLNFVKVILITNLIFHYEIHVL